MILAIETSTAVFSMALLQGTELVISLDCHVPRLHHQLITEAMHQLLANVGLTVKALTAVAIASGPGSYTGLRVAAGAAKGLCFGLDIPLIAVPTLEGLAAQVIPAATALGAIPLPLLDARRDEVYCAAFSVQAQPLTPVMSFLLDNSFTDYFSLAPSYLVIGDGAAKSQQFLGHYPQFLIWPQVQCTAQGLALPAQLRLAAGQVEDVATFEPFYMKAVRITEQRSGLKRPEGQ
jgi:tRNA threonylcarbamoyladenosine biosynthesis protein TsaB